MPYAHRVRVIVGRQQRDLDEAEVRALASGRRRIVLDVGTGTGRAVLAEADADPEALVVGLDADAASLSEVSRRAARSSRKGGRPNALFVVAAAEELPGPFAGLVDEVSVRFPWGSLLRGAVGGEDPVAGGLAGCLRPGGELRILTALQPRDGHDELLPLVEDPDRLAAHLTAVYAPLGIRLLECRLASAAEVATAESSWARRLGVGRDRGAVLARLRRDPA